MADSATVPDLAVPLEADIPKAPAPNLVIISDLHAGCRYGLWPIDASPVLDGGVGYVPSHAQREMWRLWQDFWYRWVPMACRGEPFAIAANGDMLDGRHHKAVTQVSQNLADQETIAYAIMEPLVSLCAGRFYALRGTEAHSGASAENEERLARRLGAIPDADGHHARYELYIRIRGPTGPLVHLTHHIGTTGRTHYESSAPMAELGEMYTEAGRWGDSPPDVVIRSHRHRCIEVRVPTRNSYGIVATTAGWQAKTPFVWKLPGGRIATPQFGGTLVRKGDEELYTRHYVRRIGRPEEEVA